MPVSEAHHLKPADPSIANSDDWEIFVLSDAHVVAESHGRPVSLLEAYVDNPLRVQGRLEGPGRGQTKYFLQKPYKPAEIEICNVTRFSYGETTDGNHVLWAQGKAGWFEIQPAARYRRTFDDMLQAVQLLYWVTDIYSEQRKKGGGPSASLLFQEYAEDQRFTCSDPAGAEKIFNKHRVFLIMCFLNREQTVGWPNTPLYKYFKKRHPRDFETCKARVEGRFSHAQPEQEADTSKSSSRERSKPATTTSKSTSSRGKTVNAKPDPPPKKDNNWWEAAALFEFMQKAVNHRALRPGKNLITLKRVAELVVKRYEIEELEDAQNALLVHARNLCYMMDHPRRKSVQYFASEPIYEELAAGHNLSAAEQRKAEGIELRPRKDHATLRDDVSSSDTSDQEDEDIVMTPQASRRPAGHRRKGRLSVLRPKSGKYSGKSKGKGKAGKGKAPFLPSESTSDDSRTHESGSDSSSDAEMEMDTPTHVFSPGREKRKLNETDVDEKEDRSRRKRAASASLTPDSPPTSADSEEEQGLAASALPIHYAPRNGHGSSNARTKPPLTVSLVSTPLPTYTANGPRDSWICSFDGCSQRIYGCSKPRGQELITEHLEDHSRGREKVVGILWREQDKLNLPVNNLIKKIRELTEASTPLFPASGAEKVLPQPIRRPV